MDGDELCLDESGGQWGVHVEVLLRHGIWRGAGLEAAFESSLGRDRGERIEARLLHLWVRNMRRGQ